MATIIGSAGGDMGAGSGSAACAESGARQATINVGKDRMDKSIRQTAVRVKILLSDSLD